MLEDTSDCNSSSDSESGWDDVEVEELDQSTTCLFCIVTCSNPEAVFTHCELEHELNFLKFSKQNHLDSISYIKLINFLRTDHISPATLLKSAKDIPWNHDKFMKPVNPDDPLLTFDIESLMEENTFENGIAMEEGEEEENVVLPKSKYEALLQKLSMTESQLENAWDRIERLKDAAKTVLCSDSNRSKKDHSSCDNDQYYFSSYDHFGVHHDMLQDKIRTLAYQEAIIGNKEVFQEKVVMDIGCGTSILSMFAATAGAKKVLAIDKSHVIYQAMDIVRENGLEAIVDLHKGRIEDVPSLPEEKVDIIVSEWMGYFLLFEGMLDSVIFARDKYLSPGGLMFPDRSTMSIVAMSDSEKYENCVGFWNDVYGYKMTVMRKEVIREANVEPVKADALCSEPVVIKEFDITTCKVEDTEFSTKFSLTMTKTCKVTALCGFFDCFFEKELPKKVVLSTSPLSESTHWKQTMFLFPDPIDVKEGEVLACRLSCRKNRRDRRTLIIKIDFGSAYNQYYLA